MSDPTPPATERTSPTLAVSENTGLPANIAAALSCIFTLVGGVVFLVLERKDRFVRFYSMQSIILGTVALLVWISVEVVDFIFRHIPLIGGLVTEAFQTPLAHVNILSRGRNTPNMALRDARHDPRLAPYFAGTTSATRALPCRMARSISA